MTKAIMRPGDRPNFVEGWQDLRNFRETPDIDYLVVQSLCRIVDLSQQAVEQLGLSHRGFKVGCAILALDEIGKRTGIYFGGNFTPYEGAEWNCAEKRALKVVQERGFNKVLAIAVSGPPQIDRSGVESPTLHPCYRCRPMLVKSPLTTPDILIATSTPDDCEHELHTLDSLIRLHETGQPQPFPDYHPLLPHCWRQILEFDPEDEKREMEILDRMARIVNPPRSS